MKSIFNISAIKLWIIGILVWCVYFIGVVLLAFASMYEITFKMQAISIIYNLLFIGFVVYLFRKTLTENKKKKKKWLSFFLKAILIIAACYFVYRNCTPNYYVFNPDTPDSPFDSWWLSCTQTHFGYPGPFLRILTFESVEYGKYIFDIASLAVNMALFMFFAYILIGANLIIQWFSNSEIPENS